jgi:hypothetical protein
VLQNLEECATDVDNSNADGYIIKPIALKKDQRRKASSI